VKEGQSLHRFPAQKKSGLSSQTLTAKCQFASNALGIRIDSLSNIIAQGFCTMVGIELHYMPKLDCSITDFPPKVQLVTINTKAIP
jgi:hypothetical protein